MSALCPTMSRTKVMLLAPVFFGAAHLHHFVESVRRQRWRAWSSALAQTGMVWAPLAAHILCNFMGFPRLSARGSLLARITGLALHVAGIGAFIAARYPLTSLIASPLYR
ncbi:unnamed protein product [Malassezia sympodialis ATCC 42132]|uniref:uncharacterized protein n=1 Tax=Malassezia sympodialis (strain ATCC 42132) TaxID=1230383 RepID=UPI0002C29E5B|nr:uncharacterized protein MSY001_1585 [Malassezia sympodialis ATCC 42132]CCU98879.1 unnamed protein product [Malassezia sympodialis ATCC 42132]|eukprot:XP_018740160.1 uncharacterized protein MSY001_1585 [Malassezia sympodialis ATCC 42132]